MALFSHFSLSKTVSRGLCVQLCKTLQISDKGQVAYIKTKAYRELNRVPKPKPFPYQDKIFEGLCVYTDPMMGRFDENSKLIVVDGPIGAGKNEFAKKLADELEMAYFPPLTFDDALITANGFDYRSLNSKLSPSGQFYDIDMFLQNPNHPAVPVMQRNMYLLQYNQYITALLHILSTGEGVVLNRCYLSSMAFIKASVNAGYMPEKLVDFFQREHYLMSEQSLRPHLLIYMDLPVHEVKARIKKSNYQYEANSKVLTTQFLTDIEKVHKEEYLPQLSSHTHILQYDATNELDLQDVVWDIEDLDFESEIDKIKLRDWVFTTIDELRLIRNWFSHEKDCLYGSMINDEVVEELFITAEDSLIIEDEEEKIPELIYSAPYNRHMGMSYLFKGEVSPSEEREMLEKTLKRLGKKE